MPMMLIPTRRILLDAFAYAGVDDADAKMPNVACHLDDAYDMAMMPPLVPQLMLVMMQC